MRVLTALGVVGGAGVVCLDECPLRSPGRPTLDGRLLLVERFSAMSSRSSRSSLSRSSRSMRSGRSAVGEEVALLRSWGSTPMGPMPSEPLCSPLCSPDLLRGLACGNNHGVKDQSPQGRGAREAARAARAVADLGLTCFLLGSGDEQKWSPDGVGGLSEKEMWGWWGA